MQSKKQKLKCNLKTKYATNSKREKITASPTLQIGNNNVTLLLSYDLSQISILNRRLKMPNKERNTLGSIILKI